MRHIRAIAGLAVWLAASAASGGDRPPVTEPDVPGVRPILQRCVTCHGGDDPGTQSVLARRYEKEFTLDWARRLQRLLATNGWQAFLTRTNDVDVPLGRSVYTGMFNERGGFESDLTVVRIGVAEFYLISGTAQTTRDIDWIRRHWPGRLVIKGILDPDDARRVARMGRRRAVPATV